MDTIMFGGGGLLFVILGLFLIKKHRSFVANCIMVEGRVVDIVDKVYTTRGIFGQVTSRNTVKAPVVQYKYNKLYQFQAEIDVRTHKLTQDSRVEVLINPRQPRTAKLRLGAQDNAMVFYAMTGLGVFILILGIVQFNPNDFNFDFFYDPLTLAIVAVSGVFLYLKLWPMLSLIPNTPIYTENAKEVNDQEAA